MSDDNGSTKWTDEYIESLLTSEMNIKCIYYNGCRIEKSRTSGGAPKWLLFLSEEEGAMLKDTFPTKEQAMDYIDALEEEKKKSEEKRKPAVEYKYPMVDRSEFVERSMTVHRASSVVNIGYAEGLLSDERPFRLECWAEDQITNITIFVSILGIEHFSPKDVINFLETERLFRRRVDDIYGSVLLYKEDNGNEFWSVSLVVGDEENTYLDFTQITKWDAQYRKNKWQSNR